LLKVERWPALLFVTTFWTLCSSSRRWRAFGKNWVTNFAISAAVLCHGTAAVSIGPPLMAIWADSVRSLYSLSTQKQVAEKRTFDQTESVGAVSLKQAAKTARKTHPNGCGVYFETSEPFWGERVWDDDRNAVNDDRFLISSSENFVRGRSYPGRKVIWVEPKDLERCLQ
jgi:hypothetical protein